MFRLNQNGNLKYYTISSFEETGMTKHCFTTRCGGVSEGYYSSMNLRWNCDDDPKNIEKNYEIICDEIGIDKSRLVLSKQVHEANVHTVTDSDIGNGIMFPNKFDSADALITDKTNVAITVFGADCVPLFFLDPKNKVIALAHSGWKGTVLRIGQRVVEKMVSDYNSNPADILTAIGPSIQVCHFEVGDEVADKFISEFGYETVEKHGEKYHVNMQRAIKMQFSDAGILNSHIDDSAICTYCRHDLLFSHRQTQGKRGVMGGFLALK